MIVAEAALLSTPRTTRAAGSIFGDNCGRELELPHRADRPAERRASPVDAIAAVQIALEKRTDVVAARKNVERGRQPALREEPEAARGGPPGRVRRWSARPQNAGARQAGNLLPVPIPAGSETRSATCSGSTSRPGPWACSCLYPIPNRTARAAEARARIGREQQEATLRRLEDPDHAGGPRRRPGGGHELQARGLHARRARTCRRQRLDAEEKRFAAGMSTNFLVTQSQRDLAVAEVAELRAIADYRKSLVNFERVQEAGGGVLFSQHAHRGDRGRQPGARSRPSAGRTRLEKGALGAPFLVDAVSLPRFRPAQAPAE